MDYREIHLRYDEANHLMYETLLHVMRNLPSQGDAQNNTIDFKYMLFRPVVFMEDQCSGERSRVTVNTLTLIGNELYYNGHLTDFDDHDPVEDGMVDYDDGETCREFLDAIPEDIMLQIKPFRPLPQSVILLGFEEAKVYDELWNSDDIEGLKELSQSSGHNVIRKNYPTQSERRAYFDGIFDAVGWLNVRCFENDKRTFDIE